MLFIRVDRRVGEVGRWAAWVWDTRFEVSRGKDAEVWNKAGHDSEL